MDWKTMFGDQAAQIDSKENLLELFRSEGVDITMEAFDRLSPEGELDETALGTVAGGANWRMILTFLKHNLLIL